MRIKQIIKVERISLKQLNQLIAKGYAVHIVSPGRWYKPENFKK